jgi:hypothetical protein
MERFRSVCRASGEGPVRFQVQLSAHQLRFLQEPEKAGKGPIRLSWPGHRAALSINGRADRAPLIDYLNLSGWN